MAVDQAAAAARKADRAAAVVARRFKRGRPAPVRRGMNHVFRADDVLIRVTVNDPDARATPSALEAARRQIAVAAVLTDAGIPCPEPLGEADEIDGLAVTVWRFIEIGDPGRVDYRAVGAVIARLHQLSPDAFRDAGGLPVFSTPDWLDIEGNLTRVSSRGLLDETDLDVLRTAFAERRHWAAVGEPGSPLVVCHGDLHPQNILARRGGGIAIVDWDDICLGPRAWDHAALMTWSERWGGDARTYPDFAAGYGADLSHDPPARLLAEIKLLAPTVNKILDGEHDEDRAREGRVRLRFWHGDPAAPVWTPQ